MKPMPLTSKCRMSGINYYFVGGFACLRENVFHWIHTSVPLCPLCPLCPLWQKSNDRVHPHNR